MAPGMHAAVQSPPPDGKRDLLTHSSWETAEVTGCHSRDEMARLWRPSWALWCLLALIHPRPCCELPFGEAPVARN